MQNRNNYRWNPAYPGPNKGYAPPTGGNFSGGWNSSPFVQGSENAMGRQPIMASRPQQQGMGAMPMTGGPMQMDPNRLPQNIDPGFNATRSPFDAAGAAANRATQLGQYQPPAQYQPIQPQGMPPRSGGAPIAPMAQAQPRGMLSPPPMDRMDPKRFKTLMANATQTGAMGTHNEAMRKAQTFANTGRLSDKQMKKLGITARR